MIYEGLFVSLQRPTKNNDPMKELYFADHGRNVAGLDFASKGCHFCTRRRQQHFTVGEESEMRQSSSV